MSNPNPMCAAACVLDTVAGQLRAADADRNDLGKIDWSNLRTLVANLLVQFGPILISLLADRLAPADAVLVDPKTPEA